MTTHDESDSLNTARQTLQTFEQILEVMPNDRSTLEAALMAAYHCGEEEKALTYRLRLADCLLAEGDQEELDTILALLRESDDARVKDWLVRYDQRKRQVREKAPSVLLKDTDEPTQSAVPDEMDLAWHLHEHGHLTQEEYANVVRDLTELSTNNQGETVSVLHALEATQHKNLEQILDYLSQTGRTPYISLASFDLRAECAQFLSANYIRHRAALVFDLIGNELLVTVLNPLNEALRADVEKKTRRRCHFYLTRASEFETAMHKLLSAQTDQATHA